MKIETTSTTWFAVKSYIDERLADQRGRLEGDLNRKETIAVRASIRELKKLLSEAMPDDAQFVALEIQQQE